MTDLTQKRFDRILVVKLSAIGDVIMATPFARGLKDLYPDAQIDWVVEPLSADILRGNPYLRDVIVWNRAKGKAAKGLKGVLSFAKDTLSLRRRLHGRYDVAFDIQGLGRSAAAMWAGGAPIRVGKDDAREGGRLLLTHAFPVPEPTYRAAIQYTGILRFLGHQNPPIDLEVFPDDGNRARADALLAGFDSPRGFVSITPATTRPYKHWTNEAFAETLDLLKDSFGLEAVIHGGPADVEMAEGIAGLCRSVRPRIVAGQTTLRDAAEVIRRSRLLVGVDTGLMHFGMATGTPTVAIFGPTNPHRLRDEPHVRVLRQSAILRQDNIVKKRDWWEDRSIDLNTPADVLAAASDLLSEVAAA
ncbi:MAG TPA: glycosyltransferase family 9 protein [Armatimonadota bacterium]|jgi:heptosyltransferase-1